MNTVMADDAKKSNERELGNDCENDNVLGFRSILRAHLVLESIQQQPKPSLNAFTSSKPAAIHDKPLHPWVIPGVIISSRFV